MKGVCILAVLYSSSVRKVYVILSYYIYGGIKKYGAQIINWSHINPLAQLSKCNQVEGEDKYFFNENRSDYTSNIDRVVSN